jgi:F-type H+-transporting ATPase subunit beta
MNEETDIQKSGTPELPWVGRVRRVVGQIAVVECEGDYRPRLQESMTARDNPEVLLEAYSYAGDRILYCLLFSRTEQLVRNMQIVSLQRHISIPVGHKVLGRAIDFKGDPADGLGPLVADEIRSIYAAGRARTSAELARSDELVETGIKIIDFFAPILRGGKMGLVGGAGVGKTLLQTEILRNIIHARESVAIFAGIGERTREGYALWHTLKEQEVLDRTALVFGYVNKNAAVRLRTAASAAALAEYFRDEPTRTKRMNDVLFFVDNVFRFLQAGSELSTLLGEIPSEFGYQPTLQSEIAQFENRLVSTRRGSITSVQTVYVPADELANPAVASTLPHLDTTVILSRAVAERGRYPAVDPLRSSANALNVQIVGADHYRAVTAARTVLAQYDKLARMAAVVGAEELSAQNQQTYNRAERLLNYMTQSFFTAAVESGREGVVVERKTVVKDVLAILEGATDMVPPEKLLYISDLKSAGIVAQ